MKKNKMVIDRIEGSMAVLKNGEKNINLPLDYLPDNSKEGEILNISIYKNENETGEKKQEAKDILNEILKNSNDGM